MPPATTPSDPSATPPLDGVRVLELSSSIAGETAGLLLADLGADVVQVASAPPPVSVPRAFAGWLFRNRGKRLAHAEAGADLRRGAHDLLTRADIVIVDQTPGALQDAGLTISRLLAHAPACVPLWLPPVSATGRFCNLPHDQLLLDALSGFASYVPAQEDRPIASVGTVRPVMHGALGAAHAVIELLGRERTGEVGPVVVSGLRTGALLNHLLMIAGVDGPMVYSGNKGIEGNAHYRFYETADGEWLFLGALGDALFIEALNVLDRLDVLVRPDVAGEFSAMLIPEVTAAVGRELQETFLTRPASEWLERFEAVDVPIAQALRREDWLGSGMVAHACPPLIIDHREVGSLAVPGVPLELSSPSLTAAAPPCASDVVSLAEMAECWNDRAPLAVAVRPRTTPPLAGLKVLESALFVAAPVIGSLLAAAGANVLKIEPPSGDPYRAYGAAWAAVNDGKRITNINLADPAGRTELLDLAAASDVLIDNLRRASLDRLGLTPDVLEAANPALIRASVTAFGQTGPWEARPGFDPILQAVSGLAKAQGGDDRPVGVSSPPHDLTTGVLGTLGIAASLYAREHGAAGRRVFVSLAASSTLLQGEELAAFEGCPTAPVGGWSHPGLSPWHRYVEAADGWLAYRAGSEGERAALLQALDAEVLDGVDALFVTRTVDEWLERLSALGVPAGPVLARGDFEAPWLADARFVREIDAVGIGRLRVLDAFRHTDWEPEQ